MTNKKSYFINRNALPKLFPTHRHHPQFWEQLGRTIASFGFLEEILGKAIFAFTATKTYTAEEAEAAYQAWRLTLEKALYDQLYNLAESYGKAVREHQDSTIENIEDLVADIKSAAELRNLLCHASWGKPDNEGKSIPFFVNRHMKICDRKIDIDFLTQVQSHIVELACSVMETVSAVGWQFPGSNGPGEKIWQPI